MSSLLFAALVTPAQAEAVIEFKTAGPVQIFVDGQQATLTSNLKQRVAGLSGGVHALEVSGMFGKKLYEAEIDLPDNTITFASWERGEIKVLRTEWLGEEEVEPVAEAAAEEPAMEELVSEAPAAEEPVAEEPVVEEVAAAALPVEDLSGGIVDVASPPVPVSEEVEIALAPVVAAPPVAPALAAPAEALALTPPKSNTLTIQAYDGMRVVLTHEGRQVMIVVDGDQFRIQDQNGLNLALGGE